jgi:hypothetical protein
MNVQEIVNVGAVCRATQEASRDELVWEALCRRDFGWAASALPERESFYEYVSFLVSLGT